MSRKTWFIILLVLSVVSLLYAIYRSTEETITIAGPTQQTIFGAPQHGLLLGLCIFSATCLAGAILLLRDRPNDVHETTAVREEEERKVVRRNW